MNTHPSKKFAVQLFFEIIGSICIAAAIYNFAVQAEFPMTGFSGISIILFQLLNIPIGLSTILLNIPVALLCYKLLGKKFFVSSIRCMLISSFFIDYIAPLFPVYDGDRLLAALCTGVIGGFGYALIYMQNSSTGGSDYRYGYKSLKPTYSSWKNRLILRCNHHSHRWNHFAGRGWCHLWAHCQCPFLLRCR